MAPKKLPNGKWQIRWRDQLGNQRARNFVFKADAIATEVAILSELQRGTHVPATSGRLPLRVWADQWLAGAMNLGQGGRDTYRRDLDKYVLPALGDTKLRDLTTTAIETYLAAELDRDLAPSTVHRHYRTLRRMLQIAVDRQLLPRNPCDGVRPPKISDAEMRFLTVDQVDALAGDITARYRAWVYVAAYGGLRWSETVGLRRASIDGDRLTVTEQLIRRADRSWERTTPKTRAGRRTIAIPSFLVDELDRHLATWSQPGPDGLVFPNSAGRPMNGPSFRGSVFTPACAKAGLGTVTKPAKGPVRYDTDVRIHDLRHTAVALAIAAGAHPKAIQARMGHASINVTLDRYGHLFPELDADLAAGLEQLRPRPDAASGTGLASPDTARQ